MKQILISKEDSSANIVMDKFEARFVQRTPEYFIIYVSSHKGCNQACRFCHLTQTKQTDMTPASLEDYLEQTKEVLEYWQANIPADVKQLRKVHINFMARGEPLLNPIVNDYFDTLQSIITDKVKTKVKELTGLDVHVHFNISTIFPKSQISFVESKLCSYARKADNLTFYYSLYSANPDFRKRWLPKALSPKIALYLLSPFNYKIHYALIAGENDSLKDAADVVTLMKESSWMKYRNFQPSFNLVRYNPYSEVQGSEPTEEWTNTYLNAIRESGVFAKAKIVSRVGRDVYASCGTFLNIKE